MTEQGTDRWLLLWWFLSGALIGIALGRSIWGCLSQLRAGERATLQELLEGVLTERDDLEMCAEVGELSTIPRLPL